MSRAGEHLRFESSGRVSIITIDRAAKRNALTTQMITDMTALVTGLLGETNSGALVLAGEGPVFCSGFDLATCKDSPDGSVMRELLSGLSELVVALRALPMPVVIAAQGAALAGGCAILGGGDVVVTNADAKLGYPVVRIGVSPAVSAPFLIGMTQPGAARNRMLDPGLASGEQALRLGLAHYCLSTPEEVLPKALEVAGGLAARPPAAMIATKAWLLEQDATALMASEGLRASLQLTGSDEERELLAKALAPAPRRPE